jgi:TolA-binding protein
METLPVLSMVRRELQRKKVSVAELSRGLKINSSSVCGMLKSPTFQVQRLAELSEFLNYNFFRELAATLPCAEPVFVQESKQSEVAELQNRIKELEMEVGILRQTFKDLLSNR